MQRRTIGMSLGLGLTLSIVLLTLLMLAAPSANAQQGDEHQLHLPAIRSSVPTDPQLSGEFAPGEILVGARDDVIGAAFLDELDGSLADLQILEVTSSASASQETYLLRTEPGDEWRVIEQLQQIPAVAYAEPNWIVRAADMLASEVDSEEEDSAHIGINDPYYPGRQWYLQRMQAMRGWANSGQVQVQNAASDPIVVAVIDSGVDWLHPDLRENVSLQFENYVNPGQLPRDDCGHGTHIAGLIGATINNGAGIAGVAADVDIFVYKTLSYSSPNDCVGKVSDIAHAIRDATDAGAEIINLSIELFYESTTLKTAVEYAANKGVLLVGAAGNCNISSCPLPVAYPAKYPAVMAVAATDYRNAPAAYSAVGPEIDIAAPGGTDLYPILSTWSLNALYNCSKTTNDSRGGVYCEDIGTSMAAGLLSGAAALAWSVDSTLTASDVASLLKSTAQPLDAAQTQVGNGLVDVEGAVRYALQSRLNVEPYTLQFRLPVNTPPFDTSLVLENPSLEPITWTITGTKNVAWIRAVEPVSGSVRYGEPSRVTVELSPTHVVSGTYANSLTIVGERERGGKFIVPLASQLTIYTPTEKLATFLPGLSQPPFAYPWPKVAYRWELPDHQTAGAMERVVRQVPKDSSIGITLPVTITLGTESYTDARIFSDGRVVLPGSVALARKADRCLPHVADSGMIVYGWWADLVADNQSQVSTFQAGPESFVIEYLNVALNNDAEQRRLSFQIVLHENGGVGLNYRNVPAFETSEVNAVVGVQRNDGRFYNEIACMAGEREIGTLPVSRQSFYFAEGDLY